MIENLRRVREPLAWTLVAVAAVHLVLGLAALVPLVVNQTRLNPSDGGYGLLTVAWSIVQYPVALALAVVVLGCLLAPATRHARLLAQLGAWVLAVAAVIAVVSLAWGSVLLVGINAAAPFDLLRSAADLAISVAVAIALWTVVGGVDDADGEPVAEPGPAAAPTQEAAAPDDPSAPTWSRGEATGTVWRTAAEAATGAPGSASLESEGGEGDNQTVVPPGGDDGREW